MTPESEAMRIAAMPLLERQNAIRDLLKQVESAHKGYGGYVHGFEYTSQHTRGVPDLPGNGGLSPALAPLTRWKSSSSAEIIALKTSWLESTTTMLQITP